MIKGVLFDFGGVILDLDMDYSRKLFKEKAGYDTINQHLNPYHQSGFWHSLEDGSIDEQTFIQNCLECSRPGTSKETIVECFSAFLVGIPKYKVEFLRGLGKQYPIYILSNTNPLAMNLLQPMFEETGFNMDEIFTKVFLSYEMKVMKPDPKIYQMAIEGTGFKPEELLFIDDNMTNVEAARAQGMNAEFYDIRGNLRDFVLDVIGKYN